jgi:hypothetical protein
MTREGSRLVEKVKAKAIPTRCLVRVHQTFRSIGLPQTYLAQAIRKIKGPQ